MPGILREVAEHALKIRLGSKSVKQRGHRRGDYEAFGGRVHQGSIPPRVVSQSRSCMKKSGKWRMCVDYIGLSKACSKDPFPLPCIDQVVDSTSGCETLCFLDAYFGYHQITMKESDQLMTSFITLFESFCYVTMPFGLKMQGLCISVVCSSVSGTSSGKPLRPT